jgi:hypothetical protein
MEEFMNLPFKIQITLLTILIASCGPQSGMKTTSMLAPGSNQNENNNIVEPPTFDIQNLNGSVAGGPADKQTAIYYDVSEHAILVRVPMPGMTGSVDVAIPNVPGSRVYIDNTNPVLPVLVVSVPGMYVLGHLGFTPGQVGLDPTILPNGQPLPFTPGGEPPRISFLVPNISRVVRIYLGVNVIGVFAEIPVDPIVEITFPIRNKAKTETIGYFSTVRRRTPFNGGFFVSLNMPTRIAGLLDDYLRKVLQP